VSFFFTAALMAHLLGLKRSLRVAAWLLLALTIAATIYLGWHYVVDDIAGIAIGTLAILLARALTGLDVVTARRLVRPGTATT
jgi:membrane-associated phospholipid phosphatase